MALSILASREVKKILLTVMVAVCATLSGKWELPVTPYQDYPVTCPPPPTGVFHWGPHQED